MVKMMATPEQQKTNEAENIFLEYREKLAQALKVENDKLREMAEQDSVQIIARASEEAGSVVATARQEAEKLLKEARNLADAECAGKFAQAQRKTEQLVRDAERMAEDRAKEKTRIETQRLLAKAKDEADKAGAQALKEAETQSARIMAKSKEESAQLVREAREKAYAEARQTSAQIINDTRERASQIVAEIISTGKVQVKKQFGLIASETRGKLENEVTRLLGQTIKSFEQITGEAEASVQAELKYLVGVIAQVEKALVPASGVPDKKNVESLPQATGETVTAPAASGKTEADGSPLYNGSLNVEVAPPYNQMQLDSLLESLGQIPGIRVLSGGGYLEGEKCVKTYHVDLGQPLPLLKLLRELPQVANVVQNRGDVAITMKTGVSSMSV